MKLVKQESTFISLYIVKEMEKEAVLNKRNIGAVAGQSFDYDNHRYKMSQKSIKTLYYHQ